MSAPTIEEMVEALDEMKKEYPLSYVYGMLDPIKSFILASAKGPEVVKRGFLQNIDIGPGRIIEFENEEHGPEVDEEFIHVWADQFEYRFPTSCPHHDYIAEFLKDMLHEAGVQAKEKK